MGKFSVVSYASWPQLTDKLHIIDKVVGQRQIYDQTKARGKI